jgi:hypothetical protein
VACLAGLGGGAKPLSKAQYDKQMTAIGKSFGAALGQFGTPSTAHKAQVAATKLQSEIGTIDVTIGAITPPAPIKADHARLVAAIGEFKRELGPVIATLKTGDTAVLKSMSTLKGLKDVDSAVQAINKAGYSIEG